MTDALTLPNGDEVTPDDEFLYNNYPYRLVWLDGERHNFKLSPLYWGDSGMDIPFRDRQALVDQWDADSEGLLTADGWADWLDDATEDPRFDETELRDLAAELPTDWEPPTTDDSGGILDRLGL